jgi:hypothetical protein
LIRLDYNNSAVFPLVFLPGVRHSVRSEFIVSYINVPSIVRNNNSKAMRFSFEVIFFPAVLTVEDSIYI